eukprot:4677340-Pleurochrysis_carterae.AAC.1
MKITSQGRTKITSQGRMQITSHAARKPVGCARTGGFVRASVRTCVRACVRARVCVLVPFSDAKAMSQLQRQKPCARRGMTASCIKHETCVSSNLQESEHRCVLERGRLPKSREGRNQVVNKCINDCIG